jgi:SAM-dependent methyltransferase/tetratricopeptide (TPR) repeat protein
VSGQARGGRRARQVDDALARGADHHRAGRWADAAAAYAEALRADPDHTDALALLGGALLRLGRPADADTLLARAVARDPAHALAWLNAGRARLALGRPADALAAFDAALDARPGFPEARVGRARALLAADRPEEAVEAATLAAANIGTAEAFALHGAALAAAARPAEAADALRRALALRPGDAHLHADLAACLHAARRPAEAEAAWEIAARLAPGDPAIGGRRAALLLADGLAHLAAGQVDAVTALRAALALDPSARAARLGLADALFHHPAEARLPDLAALLAADGLDHQRLARAVDHVLGPPPPAHANAPSRGLDPARAALLHLWLRRAIVVSPAWRTALRSARDAAIDAVIAGIPDADLALLAALADQAWSTEHADIDDTDTPRVAALVALLGASGDDAPADDAPATAQDDARRIALAALLPLSAWPQGLVARAPTHGPFRALVRRQIDASVDERALADALPAIGLPDDGTTRAVRAMYEENPYPRLVGVHLRVAMSFSAMVRGLLPHVDRADRAPVRVLVAGAGTGQHPISVAAGVRDAEVVGLDISRASLGRAARVAREHGVSNLRFVHGDITTLGPDDTLGLFDFVDCVGVLHHLPDPVVGAHALRAKLAPDGLLRLGLYSERGRADVVAARALAAEHGWLPTDSGLRAARAHLLALPAGHPAAGIAASVDFYSQSGLRDLVFHPCEHRYTPLGVATLLHAAGLVALGLQHARPEPARLYRARWPDDTPQANLARWDTLEAEHPWIFAGMIHVWCRAA